MSSENARDTKGTVDNVGILTAYRRETVNTSDTVDTVETTRDTVKTTLHDQVMLLVLLLTQPLKKRFLYVTRRLNQQIR